MAIEIQQEREGALRILALSGRLDTETAVDVELVLQDLLAAGERQFLIDLAGIGYVSSAGLRVLLSLAKQLQGGKGGLRLCSLNAAVNQVFEVAGFSKLFVIFPNRAAALREQPKVKPDAAFAQTVARLMGVPVTAAMVSPHVVELARSAADLLGVKATPATATRPAVLVSGISSISAISSSISAQLKRVFVTPLPAVKRAPAPAPVIAPPTGLISRLKRLFGGKS